MPNNKYTKPRIFLHIINVEHSLCTGSNYNLIQPNQDGFLIHSWEDEEIINVDFQLKN
jgi:hypothetical protein